MGAFSEYDKYDGLGLAELVRRKEIKPSELVEEAISRIEKLNPKLNAVIHKMYELARDVAEGDLPDACLLYTSDAADDNDASRLESPDHLAVVVGHETLVEAAAVA